MGNGTITMTGAEYDALVGKIATLEAENAKLRAELERLRQQRDKLAGLLELCSNEFKGLSMTHDLPSRIDAALAEVEKAR